MRRFERWYVLRRDYDGIALFWALSGWTSSQQMAFIFRDRSAADLRAAQLEATVITLE